MKNFEDMVKARIERSAEFGHMLLRESVNCFIAGDVDTGKSLLRQYINSTVGFIKLGADLGKSPKALMRMFSASGNPQARNLFEVISYLQEADGTFLEVIDRAA